MLTSCYDVHARLPGETWSVIYAYALTGRVVTTGSPSHCYDWCNTFVTGSIVICMNLKVAVESELITERDNYN